MMTKKKLPGYVGPRPHFCIMQHDGGWYARADFWAALAGLLFVFPLPFAFIPSPFIPLTPESAVKKCFPTLPYRRIIAFPRFPPIHTYVTHEKNEGNPPYWFKKSLPSDTSTRGGSLRFVSSNRQGLVRTASIERPEKSHCTLEFPCFCWEIELIAAHYCDILSNSDRGTSLFLS
jgi:hypothetical protein